MHAVFEPRWPYLDAPLLSSCSAFLAALGSCQLKVLAVIVPKDRPHPCCTTSAPRCPPHVRLHLFATCSLPMTAPTRPTRPDLMTARSARDKSKASLATEKYWREVKKQAAKFALRRDMDFLMNLSGSTLRPVHT
ncbi:hypothetical protein C8Q78DRAFT_177246 [Trametes maxima]|nr:hypothetical protein C8Q78DRAFT_177246 [Trametes maxima]